MEKKACSNPKCKKVKDLSEFYARKTSKDGRRSECRVCENERSRAHRINNPEYFIKNKEEISAHKMKWARNNKDKTKEYALRNKGRISEYQKQYRIDNKEVLAEQQKIWAEANQEKCKELAKQRYKRNKDKVIQRTRQWKKDNPEKHKKQLADYDARYPEKRVARVRKRQADKLQRTPAWANHDLILEFYKEAQRLTRETGIEHHVDHIIPLRGKLVSGLHVETNLQVLQAKPNLRKSNKYIPILGG